MSRFTGADAVLEKEIGKTIYLTFDMDWACDEVLECFYELILELNVAITLTVTHQTKWLERFRENEKIELGIHPNFNFLLDGKTTENKRVIIEKSKSLIPDAVTVRSHSLVQSTRLTDEFYRAGLKYELNTLIPPQEKMRILPWKTRNILQIPFMFQDDLYLTAQEKRNPDFYLGNQFIMCKVFNFHPIHLYLNSEKIERYEKAKQFYHDFDQLKEFKNTNSKGIYDFFLQLVNEAKKRHCSFKKINSIRYESMEEI